MKSTGRMGAYGGRPQGRMGPQRMQGRSGPPMKQPMRIGPMQGQRQQAMALRGRGRMR